MGPEERAVYEANKVRDETRRELAALRMQTQDQMDAAKFAGMVASNPTAAKFADKVEKFVASRKAEGYYLPRDMALKYLVGEAVMAKAAEAKAGTTRSAGARTAAQTAKPGRSGGDAVQGSRRGGRELSEAEFESRYAGTRL
jgi:hypothetical protein